MALDVAAPRADRAPRPLPLQRLAALPTWVWLGGIVLASFGGRFLAALGRVVPYYLPDEYIYPSLARSLAEHGRPLIRGATAHFPALLDPIVTAPVWLVTSDPQAAWRLTQGLHSLFVSAAAIPAYLLARRLGLPRWLGLGAATLAVAVPDAVYAGSMLADPLAYPLALGALCAGIYVTADATLRAQLAFVVLSAFAVTARIQYAVVPVAVFAGVLAADRFRFVRVVRRLLPSLVLLVAPPVVLLGVFGRERLLGPYADGHSAFRPAAIVQWVARDAMLLVYSCGWALVPGALVALAYALRRPRTRAEIGFAVTTVVLALLLLLEAAQIADTDSQRFQERYLFALVPLLGIAFGLYVERGLPAKLPVGLIATALLALAARVPLSGYAAAHNKDDSPTLWAVLRVENLVGTGNGALAVALVAAALSGVAVVGARRRAAAAVAVAVAVGACCALSAAATSFDSRISHSLRGTLPRDVRWVDHARLGPVDLLALPGERKEQSWEQLFWNHSLHRLLLLGTPEIDRFASGHVHVARDGRLLVGAEVARAPLLVQTYASSARFAGVRRVRHTAIFDLYRPIGIPRLRLLAAGRYADGWLAPRGAITVWTRKPALLRLELALPTRSRTTAIRFAARNVKRTARVRPGAVMRLEFRIAGGRPWSVHYASTKTAYLGDNRAVSVLATNIRLVPSK